MPQILYELRNPGKELSEIDLLRREVEQAKKGIEDLKKQEKFKELKKEVNTIKDELQEETEKFQKQGFELIEKDKK